MNPYPEMKTDPINEATFAVDVLRAGKEAAESIKKTAQRSRYPDDKAWLLAMALDSALTTIEAALGVLGPQEGDYHDR